MAAFSGYMLPVFAKPFIGVLIWLWIAIGTPHLETFGFTKSFQFNVIVAVVTIFLWLIYKKDIRTYKYGPMILMYVLAVVLIMATFLGEAPDYSQRQLSRILKIFIVVIVIAGLIDNRIRVHACLWIIAISLGYFGAKAGLGTLATGGSYRVSGPEGGPIGDNNHTAAGLIMVLPILNYLRMESEKRLVRLMLAGVMLLTVVGIMGTYSRGGFIGLTAMCAFFWLRSRGKVRNALIVVVVAAVGASFVPQKYYDRLSTIESADEEDKSFRERLGAWQTAINIANNRMLGVGPRAYQISYVFGRYKEAGFWREKMAMHSVFFEVLADIGYMGLSLYVISCFLVWRNLLWIISATKGIPQLTWANNAARMIEISFAGFAVAGAALSMAWFEPLWVLIGLTMATRAIVERYHEGVGVTAPQSAGVKGVPVLAPEPSARSQQ